MSLVVRSSLTKGLVDVTFMSWVVLVVWVIAAAVVTGVVMGRRR
jgi:hypothetical protein